MKSYKVNITSDNDNLFAGLDSNAIKVLEYKMIESDTSVIANVSVIIPKLIQEECQEGTIDTKSSREAILSWLKDRLDAGDIAPRSQFSPKELNVKIRNRELSSTLLSKLCVKGDSVNNKTFSIISDLIKGNRLFDNQSIAVEKDLRELYYINKAVVRGEIIRFPLGDTALYID